MKTLQSNNHLYGGHLSHGLRFFLLFLLGLSLLATSCQKQQKLHGGSDPVCSFDAQFLRLTDTMGYCRVDVLNPWQEGQLLSRLYLVEDEAVETPTDAPRVRVPLERLAVTSATQMGFLHALDADACVCALATPHLIYNAPAHETVDLGEDFNLSVERLLFSTPQLVLMTSYGESLTNVARIREAGIPVLEIVEWMEQDPLGRAAWIRLYGALTGHRTEADTILAEVERDYCAIMQETQLAGSQACTLATGESYRGTWYVPSGSTYMGKLIAASGAQYAYSEKESVGSIPLTLEQALTTFSEADVWIGVNANTLDELADIDNKHTWMKAYQSGRVYNWRRRTTLAGGNDFWETGIVHPEYILQDIRWALDSTAMPNYEPHFIKRLQ